MLETVWQPLIQEYVQAVRDTAAWCREESNWEAVWTRVNEKYGHYGGVHSINNAALVVMGLLFGAKDYETGIGVTRKYSIDQKRPSAFVSL